MAGKIFLNYRRSDAEAWADRVFERLKAHLPSADVFMDIDGHIPLGLPWATWLDSHVAACDLMLVLIGRTWVVEFQARSGPEERDYVRVEIESALSRKIPVVPVFLGDAPAPSPANLPVSIRPLLELQATRLHRTSFETDAKALIEGVVRSIKLARGDAVQTVRPSITPVSPGDKYPPEGRIKVDARIANGAPEGWFKPGAGKAEWFKDHDAGPEMVVVPTGSFMMGSPESEPQRHDNESPRHKVSIARPFAVGRHEITRGEFAAFIHETGYTTGDANVWTDMVWRNDPDISWRNPGFAQDDKHPVVCVSWDDAKAYTKWLSQQSGKSYRLLTEAEWEYAARAGTTTPFWWGSSITPAQANYNGGYTYAGGSEGEYREATVPVGSFSPNPWGLFNVHGNVWEWCDDVWHDTYHGAPSDGSVRLKRGDSTSRILRGGCWAALPSYSRAARRVGYPPRGGGNTFGFRVGRTLPS
jgi:formylglycine-generating enzyme required for sulfatase activity